MLIEGKAFCTRCGAKAGQDAPKLCTLCGYDLIDGKLFCDSCGSYIAPDDTSAGNPTHMSPLQNQPLYVHEHIQQDHHTPRPIQPPPQHMHSMQNQVPVQFAHPHKKRKSNKIAGIVAVVFILAIVSGVFFVFGLPFLQDRMGASGATIDSDENGQLDEAPEGNNGSDMIPEVPDDPSQETVPEVSEDPPAYVPGGYINEPPGYEGATFTPEQLAEGDTSSPWHPIHFTDIRTPQPLHPEVPHGYIAVNHIRHLNDYYYERFSFSYQEKRAAAWLVGELLAMGYAWDNIDIQEFHIYDVGFTADRLRWLSGWAVYYNYDYMRDTYFSQNVVLTVPGQSSQVIVVGAHYDTVLYPGASDNASGTALLLESAQRMRYIDNYYTIVYVFFGAEEVGLLGAYHFVNLLSEEELNNILFMVNADVLFEGPYFIFGGGYCSAPGTGTWHSGAARSNDITRQWEDIAYDVNASYGLGLLHDQNAIFLSSDQRVFLDAGVTVMMLYGADFTHYGREFFRVLHSYRDCYHYIMERWPNKIFDAMHTFSIFLERVLLAEY